jgi:6-phosphogluconolactonase
VIAIPTETLSVYQTVDDLNDAAFRHIKSVLREAPEDGDRPLHFVLAGGSTPKRVYEQLAAARDIDWNSIHVWFSDERTVWPGHQEANFRMATESLLGNIEIPAGNVHRMPGEDDPHQAAEHYSGAIEAHVPLGPDRWPEFDLILLGMGDDGHTASLFPGTAALQEWTRIAVANEVPQLDTRRITLTYPVLNSGRHVMFLVAGEGKAGALAQVIAGGESAPPASRVRPVRGELRWFVDRAAASLLP